MYIKIKKRTNSDMYYFYKAKSYRENGKVKNKQKYICKVPSRLIFNYKDRIAEELQTLREKDLYLFLKILTKIQWDILEEEKCTLTN